MAKKVLLYSDQEDFLLCNIAPFLPFVPIADHACSGLSSHPTRLTGQKLSEMGTKASSTTAYQERQHPPKPIHRSCCQRSQEA
jgi:hypothetical protein